MSFIKLLDKELNDLYENYYIDQMSDTGGYPPDGYDVGYLAGVSHVRELLEKLNEDSDWNGFSGFLDGISEAIEAIEDSENFPDI